MSNPVRNLNNIYNIPFGDNFLIKIAKYILQEYGDDPLYFSNLTILLPNRRSSREFSNILLSNSVKNALILPNIAPIGEINEDEILFKNNLTEKIPSVISPIKQRVILTKLIDLWQSKESKNKRSKAQSVLLSIELAAFLDEVEKEQLSFDKIKDIVPDRFSEHWQITLEFLKIATLHWPNILSELNMIGSAKYSNILLEEQAKIWQNNNQYPVIIAGSTGSIPATANLIRTVSQLKNGKIILHGLDRDIESEYWKNLEQSHPQYGLKNLLDNIETHRNEVIDFSENSYRKNFINKIMLPSDKLINDIENLTFPLKDLSNFEIVNCKDIYNEATIIAMKIRHALEKKTDSIAIITNNFNLTKLVSIKLKRWNINIDNSIGSNLKDIAQIVFLRLLARMICDDFKSPISILEVLKNPYSTCGMNNVEFKKFVNIIELNSFRGIRKNYDLYSLKNEYDEDVASWLQKIIDIVTPMQKLLKGRNVDFKTILLEHIKVAENFAQNDKESGQLRLYKGDKGEEFRSFLDELIEHTDDFKDFSASEYPSILDVMMEDRKYNSPYNINEKISVLKPVESRLLSFDLVILADLNDNSWPILNDSNPWMNKQMRKDFGLPTTEKRVGQSAHDFCNCLASKEVFITRSIKKDGIETIKSRWLSRIETITKINNSEKYIQPKYPWVEWSEELDKAEEIIIAQRCSANPPIDARPRELSVTSFEQLMRDPYGLYANKILKLRKLDEIDQDPTMADFGSFIHEAIDQFIKKYDYDESGDKLKLFLDIGESIAESKNLKSHMFAFWQSRFTKAAKWFVENEKNIRSNNVKIYSEIDGKIEIKIGSESFILKARADRIEQNEEGSLSIIDYKTGSIPTNIDIQKGYSPQMTLQAIIADNQGFKLNGKIEKINFWKIGNSENIEIKNAGYGKSESPEELIKSTEENIYNLISKMFFQQTPFIACPDRQKAPTYNDYQHLERIDL